MKFKKGDIVVIVGNHTDHEFYMGEIVTVTEYDEESKQYICASYGGDSSWNKWCVDEEDIEMNTCFQTEIEKRLKDEYDKKVQELESKLNSAEHFRDNMYGNIRFLEGQVAALEGVIKMLLLDDNG